MLRALLLGALAVACAPAGAQAQIAVGDAQVTEGAGSVTFTITRQAGLLAPAATVSFATADGSAVAPSDYTPSSGSRSFPATLLATAQSQHVTVPIADDALDEPDETFRLLLSGAGVSDGEAIGTIVDDDAAPAVGVADAAPAVEGATALFRIGLSRASGRAVSVAYATADGSAVAGRDYGARSGRITIPAGSTSAAVGVPLVNDGEDEPNETFQLRLSAPSAAALGDATGTATIVDDDEPPPAAGPPAGVDAAPSAPGPKSAPAATPPPPPTAGSGAPASDTRPLLGVSSPRLRQPSSVLVTISCPRQAGRCRGRMTVFSRPNRRSKIKALRRERRLGRRNFKLAAGSSRTLRIALSRRDRVLLKRAGRIRVRAYVVMTDGAGRTGVRRVNGTLVARTRHG